MSDGHGDFCFDSSQNDLNIVFLSRKKKLIMIMAFIVFLETFRTEEFNLLSRRTLMVETQILLFEIVVILASIYIGCVLGQLG